MKNIFIGDNIFSDFKENEIPDIFNVFESFVKKYKHKLSGCSDLEKFAAAYYYVFENDNIAHFDSTKLMQMICDELNIFVALQKYNLINEQSQEYENKGLLIFLDDEKYDYNVIGFSDAGVEKLMMSENNTPCFNMLLVPLKFIDSIKLQIFDEKFRVKATENKGLFYSNSENNFEIIDMAKRLNTRENQIIKNKNTDFLTDDKFSDLIKNVSRVMNFDSKQILKNKNKLKSLFFTSYDEEFSSRAKIKDAATKMIDMQIVKDSQNSTFDCASFITFLFMSELGIDIAKNGKGKSLTGKIMSSSVGKNFLIDEKKSLSEKAVFVIKNAEIGDVLLFHRQSANSDSVDENNWFPGHVGVYVGDGLYIDARHRRGNVHIVDILNDAYMECFIGFKKILGSSVLSYEQKQNGDA